MAAETVALRECESEKRVLLRGRVWLRVENLRLSCGAMEERVVEEVEREVGCN